MLARLKLGAALLGSVALLWFGGCSGGNDGSGGPTTVLPSSGHDAGEGGGSASDAADTTDATSPTDAQAGDATQQTDDAGADGGTSQPDSDAGSTQADADASSGTCPDTPCTGGKVCVNGACVEETPQSKCGGATDLGSLAPGASVTASGTLEGASDALAASCNDQSGTPEQVFSFTVTQDSRVDFVTSFMGNYSAVVSFRTTCDDSTSLLGCHSGDAALPLVPAGTKVFMIVELSQGNGGQFSIDLSATAESCPAGLRSCTSGELKVCSGGSQKPDLRLWRHLLDGDGVCRKLLWRRHPGHPVADLYR